MPKSRQHALEAALSLFMRLGYQKTAMDDVARGAGVSRASLYLWFSSKEELFKAAVEGALLRLEAEIKEALNDDRPLVDRLHRAFLIRSGFTLNPDATGETLVELLDETERLLRMPLARFQDGVVTQVAKLLPNDGGASAIDRAHTLMAASTGLKAQGREAYVRGMTAAIRVVLATPANAPHTPPTPEETA